MRWLKSSDKRHLTESQAEPHPARAAANSTANAPSGVEVRAGTVSAADAADCRTDGPASDQHVPSSAACTSLAAASDLSHEGATCALQPGMGSMPSQAVTRHGSALVRRMVPAPASVLSVDESQPREAVCGVRGIWVSVEARRKGIASQLLDAARHDPSVSCAWDLCKLQIVNMAHQWNKTSGL